jgi:hypothetical protein
VDLLEFERVTAYLARIAQRLAVKAALEREQQKG